MWIATTVFLIAACIVLGIIIMILSGTNASLSQQYEDDVKRIEQLEDDNKLLVNEKAALLVKYEEVYDDNVRLAAAVRQLREINNEPLNEKPVEVMTKAESKLLPDDIATNMITCEPYQVITYDENGKIVYDENEQPLYKSAFVSNSYQYKLQQECFTDPETGIRYYNSDGKRYLCAAMAGAYGVEIGHTYNITLKNGYSFDVILSDFKHPIDDVRYDDYGDVTQNYDGEEALCIIEFVVDMVYVPKVVKDVGTMTALDLFGGLYGDGGNIIEIVDTGRKWKA